jgi:hypothetical protein
MDDRAAPQDVDGWRENILPVNRVRWPDAAMGVDANGILDAK